MNTQLTVHTNPDALIKLVTDSLGSPHSVRMYRRALLDFLAWHESQGRPPLTKAVVQEYRAALEKPKPDNKKLSPASVNLRISAIRALAREAADNGYMDQALANGVSHVKGVKAQGVRLGMWLKKKEAQDLLKAPDVLTLKGLRDRAVLSLMIGAGLRRSEVASLTFEHVQQREGRWLIVDMIGKGNRVRSIPIPSWAKAALDDWAEAANVKAGFVFRAIHKGGYVTHDSITPQGVRDIVKSYAPEIAAHDLRRSFAKLAHTGGAAIEQIQLSLGHASLKTTERYLGVTQDLTDAPCDHLGLHLR